MKEEKVGQCSWASTGMGGHRGHEQLKAFCHGGVLVAIRLSSIKQRTNPKSSTIKKEKKKTKADGLGIIISGFRIWKNCREKTQSASSLD